MNSQYSQPNQYGGSSFISNPPQASFSQYSSEGSSSNILKIALLIGVLLLGGAIGGYYAYSTQDNSIKSEDDREITKEQLDSFSDEEVSEKDLVSTIVITKPNGDNIEVSKEFEVRGTAPKSLNKLTVRVFDAGNNKLAEKEVVIPQDGLLITEWKTDISLTKTGLTTGRILVFATSEGENSVNKAEVSVKFK